MGIISGTLLRVMPLVAEYAERDVNTVSDEWGVATVSTWHNAHSGVAVMSADMDRLREKIYAYYGSNVTGVKISFVSPKWRSTKRFGLENHCAGLPNGLGSDFAMSRRHYALKVL